MMKQAQLGIKTKRRSSEPVGDMGDLIRFLGADPKTGRGAVIDRRF